MSYVLRPKQEKLIGDVSVAFRSVKSVLAVAPTGFGKTLVFCDITRRTIQRRKRVYIVAHRIEILKQISHALYRAGVRYGWIAAGRPTTNDMVQIGMVATVANRINLLPEPDLLVIDEAHHATAGSYRKMTDAWHEMFILGVTASPQRTDGTGLGEVFRAMVLGPTMRETIAEGFLANFQYFAPPMKVNLSGVKSRGGDYAAEQLAEVMDKHAVTGDAEAHYRKHLNGKPAIAFCVSVAHAKHVAEQFRMAGWKAESVDGMTNDAVRADRIAAIGDGRLNILTSAEIVNEGTDIPAVAGAILLRPTMSLIVYLQQVGRVLRLKEDGSHAIILDHVSNFSRFGMPDEDREWSLDSKPRKGQAVPPVRQCPKCYAAFRPAPKCPNCGHLFEAVLTGSGRKALKFNPGELQEMNAPAEKAKRLAEAKARRTAEWKEKTRVACKLKDPERRKALGVIQREYGFAFGWIQQQIDLRSGYASKYGRRAA